MCLDVFYERTSIKYPRTVAEEQRTGHELLKIDLNRIENESFDYDVSALP